MSFDKLQGLESIKTPENKMKEGVDFVFEQNPELLQIGTRKQYSEYLDTIFPESNMKDIVYHNSDSLFKDEGFKSTKPNFDTLNSVEDVYNFSSNKKFIQRYGENIYSVILNIKQPIIENNSGEYIDDMDGPLSRLLYKIGKQKDPNIFAPQRDEGLKNVDALINYISGDEYVEKHPISGLEIGLPKQTLISVFSPQQIYILGSQKDLEKFKEFVSQNKEK